MHVVCCRRRLAAREKSRARGRPRARATHSAQKQNSHPHQKNNAPAHADNGGSGPMGCPHLHKDMLHYDQVQEQMKQIQAHTLGATELAVVPADAHPDITKALCDAVSFKFQTATVCHSMAWWFAKPAVGLDGIASHFKTAAMVATADACKTADLIVKTGGEVRLHAQPAPPHSWHLEGESDPLHAFEVALAMTKGALLYWRVVWGGGRTGGAAGARASSSKEEKKLSTHQHPPRKTKTKTFSRVRDDVQAVRPGPKAQQRAFSRLCGQRRARDE
jgi:hypothetical protein